MSSSLTNISEGFWNNREFVLSEVKKDGEKLQYASENLRNDETIVLAAVTNNGDALKYTQDCRNNKKIVLVAVKNDGDAIKYASDNLKKDNEVARIAVSQKGRSFRYIPKDMQDYRDISLVAVTHNGNTLQYASKYLQDDREIVLAAVTNDGNALRYASEDLQDDREIVLAAVTNDGNALQYAEDLQDDRDIVLAAVTNDGNALQYTSSKLKEDYDVVLAAIKENSRALEHASDRLKENYRIVRTAVEKKGRSLEHASEKLQNDRDIVLAAVLQSGWALKHASNRLKKDYDIVLASVKEKGQALKYASKDLRNNKEIVLAAVMEDGQAIKYASVQLKNDPEIELKAQKGRLSVIAQEELCFLKRLGEGGVGTVVSATWNGSLVAAKALKRNWSKETLILEAKIMRSLIHPNVITFYGLSFCREGQEQVTIPYIIMEYSSFGSLWDYMLDNPLEEKEKLSISYSIASGLLFLHNKNIVHRDLKSQNVLLDLKGSTLVAKLADFGFAKTIQSSSRESSRNVSNKGTTAWMAPEIRSPFSAPSYTKACDIYSYGIVVWETLRRNRPYKPSIKDSDSEGKISIKDHLGEPMNASDILEDLSKDVSIKSQLPLLITRCLESPSKRPKIEDICSFFSPPKAKRPGTPNENPEKNSNIQEPLKKIDENTPVASPKRGSGMNLTPSEENELLSYKRG